MNSYQPRVEMLEVVGYSANIMGYESVDDQALLNEYIEYRNEWNEYRNEYRIHSY